VNPLGIKKDALGQSGFTGVDMGADADVTYKFGIGVHCLVTSHVVFDAAAMSANARFLS
jgi:hypothetical protein